jgi:hypothetical protein
MFQPMPVDVSQFTQLPQMKPKGGMFGGGDWKQALAAALSAWSAARGNPAGQIGLQMLNQRLGQKREDQQYEQRRQAELQDYGEKLKMQAQYAKPNIPDIQERIQVLESIKPGLGKTYAQNYAQNGGGLGSIFRDPATGQAYMMPQGLPPLGEEMDDPRKQGGPSPLGSGGFPGSF